MNFYHYFFLLLSLTCTQSILQAQLAVEGNEPTKTTSLSRLPEGPEVMGVYDGRCPCKDIARQMKVAVGPDCIKLKWRITIYQDAATQKATTYTFFGSFFREEPMKGNITTLKGIPTDPDATVYQLHLKSDMGPFYLLKASDDVLFILDDRKNFYVGNIDFSYTMNRVRN